MACVRWLHPRRWPQPSTLQGVKPNPVDLFGEVPVTWPEVWAWCEAVAGIPRESHRAARYAAGWNVPDKIRRAKLAGTFELVISREPPPPHWWARFRWH